MQEEKDENNRTQKENFLFPFPPQKVCCKTFHMVLVSCFLGWRKINNCEWRDEKLGQCAFMKTRPTTKEHLKLGLADDSLEKTKFQCKISTNSYRPMQIVDYVVTERNKLWTIYYYLIHVHSAWKKLIDWLIQRLFTLHCHRMFVKDEI